MRWELRGDFTTDDDGLSGSNVSEIRLLLALTRGVGRRQRDRPTARKPAPPPTPSCALDAIDTPTATTVLEGADEILPSAVTGQLPELAEFAPAVELTQNGLYDYNLNARGLNRSLNRRVAVSLDGRDASEPFFGAPEWSAVPWRFDELAHIDWRPGPASATHGPGGAGGTLEFDSRPPGETHEGEVRLAAGELGTQNIDAGWSGGLGHDWRLRLQAGRRESDGFAASRDLGVEYATPCAPGSLVLDDCLGREAVALPDKPIEIVFGNVRLDRPLPGDRLFSVEVGMSDASGEVIRTDIGRIRLEQVERPWIHTGYSTPHWRLGAIYDRRDAKRQRGLRTGSELSLETSSLQFDVETFWDCLGDTAEVRLAASYVDYELDSLGPAPSGGQQQTLMAAPVDSNRLSLGGEFDWSIAPRVRLHLAGRWDDDSLYDTRFSPRATLTLDPAPERHAVRFGAGRAYQSPSHAEYFLRAALEPAFDLATLTDSGGTPLNSYCAPDCGLAEASVLALGNRQLELEEITSFELGYRARWGQRVGLDVTWHEARHEHPIIGLIPQIDPVLGRVNPAFGAWVGSAQAEANLTIDGVTVADEVRAQVPALSLDDDGTTIVAAASYTNLGRADSHGVDADFEFCITDAWTLSAGYSWFDQDVRNAPPGLADQLLPNAPENRFGLTFSFARAGWSSGLGLRWVDEFRWVDGLTKGDVPSFTAVDLGAAYRLNEHWKAGAQIGNLLDDAHWESFGGDLLRRRALAHLTYSWK